MTEISGGAATALELLKIKAYPLSIVEDGIASVRDVALAQKLYRAGTQVKQVPRGGRVFYLIEEPTR